MKAIVVQKYGNPENIVSLEETEKPSPKPNEVLIKVCTTAVNDYDWCLVTGKPFMYRLIFGLFKPKHPIPGMEVAGIIEQTGSNVHKYKVGDAVFGDISNYGFGSFAEYISINEDAVCTKPSRISFEEATAIPHAAALALQAFNKSSGVKNNQRILINGGGGGVGTIALQLAKLYDCHVTGVDSTDKFNMMKSLGFDTVMDYKTTDFTKTGEQYDFILDCKSNKSVFSYAKAIKPKGSYVTIGGSPSNLIKILFWGNLMKLFSGKKLQILALQPNQDLDYICDLVQQGKIKCKIDGPFPLKEAPQLIQYFGEGKHKGKVVIRVSE